MSNRAFQTVTTRMHIFWYRLSGGALLGSIGKAPVLLLTTTGRKSGRERTTPLIYLEDGADLVVVASNAGSSREPGWWRNLKAHPEATVVMRKETRRVRAEQASAELRAELWPRLTAFYPAYDEYTKMTTREIPVVVLRPA